MAEVLELAELLQDDRVAEVDVGRGRVEAELRAELPPLARGLLELALQAPLREGVDGVAGEERRGVRGGGVHPAPMLVSSTAAGRAATSCHRSRPPAALPRRMSDANGSPDNVTPLFADPPRRRGRGSASCGCSSSSCRSCCSRSSRRSSG